MFWLWLYSLWGPPGIIIAVGLGLCFVGAALMWYSIKGAGKDK